MKTLVTVGICMKNAKDTIGETLKAVLEQDYPPELVEIIVVDGGSSDSSVAIVRLRLEKTHRRWKLYSDGRKGLGFARQIVIDHGRGKYVVYVDSDVVIEKDLIRRQQEFMENNTRVGIGLSRFLHKDGNWLLSAWSLYHSFSPNFVGCAFSCRKAAILRVGGFDKQIVGAGEDVELIGRVESDGWLVSTCEAAKFRHNFRQTLRGFWSEHIWFGYGGYYIAHKDRGRFAPWRSMPPGQLIFGIRAGSRLYRATRRKISFVIGPLLVFGSVAWCFGFLKAALFGYHSGR
ncbi:MAG: glycosyltransferase [Candidatus Bathyarchaeia archaeon]